MAKTNQVKVFYREVYPVCEKKILGLFKIRRVLSGKKIGSELMIEGNVKSVDAIYFNGKKIWKKKY